MKAKIKNSVKKLLLRLLADEDKIVRWRKLGATIGQDVFIGFDVSIDEGFAQLLTIEDGVVISARTLIILHDSAFNNLLGLPIKVGQVVIKQQAYIGVNSTILCGVTIGQQAVVGAGSVVVKDVPARTIAFGCPAVVHGTLDEFRIQYEQRVARPCRYEYWHIMPWRERRKRMSRQEIDASLESFLQHFVNFASSDPDVS